MIPTVNTILNSELEMEDQPSKNYKMYLQEDVINGYNDKLEAMEQVVYKILNTQRYQYIIYSWNYGIELEGLFGEQVSYVCPELERRIIEALTQDDRINSVDSFSFDASQKRVIQVTFVVHTVFGEISAEKEVDY